MTNDDRTCGTVCSLPAQDLEQRLQMIRTEIAPLVAGTRVLEDGREWRFANSGSTRAKVENLIDLERQCCRGITFELRVSPGGEHLLLSATGAGATNLFDRIGL